MNKYELFLELQRYPALLEELSKYKLQKALHQCRMMIDEFENEKFTRLEPLMSNAKKDDRRWTLHQRQARKNLSEPYDQRIKKLKYWEHKIDSRLTTNSIDERLSRLDEKYQFSKPVKPEPKERPKPQNKTAQKMYETEERNRPKKEAIIKKAVELINDTGKEYRTSNNNCRKWLWDDARIKKIDKGNARTWLDNAVKDGTINKKLKELPME